MIPQANQQSNIDAMAERLCDRCQKPYQPKVYWQRYCTPKCGARARFEQWVRRHLQGVDSVKQPETPVILDKIVDTVLAYRPKPKKKSKKRKAKRAKTS